MACFAEQMTSGGPQGTRGKGPGDVVEHGALGDLLLVDDEESVLITMQAILEEDGHRTEGATTAAGALAALERREFDVVVSDLHLDERDGLHVIAEAKRLAPACTGIILTGYASLDAVVRALRAGVDDFLVKPTDVQELKRGVARCAAKAQAARSLAEAAGALEAARRAETAARESEARFRLLADATPVMIWMAAPDKGCTFFNKQWLVFTGRSMEQELGFGWTAGVHPADLERCLSIYNTAFDARITFSMEYRVRRADGAYRWVVDNASPFRAGDGAFAGYIGACSDITERKLVEMEREVQLRQERMARVEAEAEADAARAEADAAQRQPGRTPAGPPSPQSGKPLRQTPPKPPTSVVGLDRKKPRGAPVFPRPPSSVRSPGSSGSPGSPGAE